MRIKCPPVRHLCYTICILMVGTVPAKRPSAELFRNRGLKNGKAKDWYICGSSVFPVRYKLSLFSGLAASFFPLGLIVVELLINPEAKYEADGSPGIADCIRTIRT